jgi:hypothetical protein
MENPDTWSESTDASYSTPLRSEATNRHVQNVTGMENPDTWSESTVASDSTTLRSAATNEHVWICTGNKNPDAWIESTYAPDSTPLRSTGTKRHVDFNRESLIRGAGIESSDGLDTTIHSSAAVNVDSGMDRGIKGSVPPSQEQTYQVSFLNMYCVETCTVFKHVLSKNM